MEIFSDPTFNSDSGLENRNAQGNQPGDEQPSYSTDKNLDSDIIDTHDNLRLVETKFNHKL